MTKIAVLALCGAINGLKKKEKKIPSSLLTNTHAATISNLPSPPCHLLIIPSGSRSCAPPFSEGESIDVRLDS